MDKKTIEWATNVIKRQFIDNNCRIIGPLAKENDPHSNARMVRLLVKKVWRENGNGAASAILSVLQAGEFILFKDEFYFVPASVSVTERMYKLSKLTLMRDQMEGTLTYKVNGEEILA